MSFSLSKTIHPYASNTMIQEVHRGINSRAFSSRCYEAIQTINHEEGMAKTALLVGTLSIAQISSLAVSYFCMEGAVRSLIDVHNDQRAINSLRPLGDFGGWCSLFLFSTIVMQDYTERFIGEGDYLRLKSICKKWILENKTRIIEEDSEVPLNVYEDISELLNVFSIKCLFSRTLVSRRLIALEIQCEVMPKDESGQRNEDLKLQEIFRSIQLELEQKLSFKQYFQRLFAAQRVIQQEGRHHRFTPLFFGIAVPIVLLSNAILSIVGEIGLGKELYIDKEGLTDTGHFGEWPINAVESSVTAYFLHKWYVINEGDFAITQSIFAQKLEGLRESKTLYNRLCGIANEELLQISANCAYVKIPMEYKFKEL
jgi:hypothetical protein